ncbi:MAG: hypothetical protein ACRD9S_04180 [Pyrinomonadaceae bacterium]
MQRTNPPATVVLTAYHTDEYPAKAFPDVYGSEKSKLLVEKTRFRTKEKKCTPQVNLGLRT